MKFGSLSVGCWVGAAVTVMAGLACVGSRPAPVKPANIALRRHHDPMQIHRRRDQTTSESYNWSGYAVTGSKGSVTDVKGSWIVPAASCSASLGDSGGYASFWVGIDGWTSNTVEQIGTDSDCVSPSNVTDTPTYYAWFEFYPHSAYYIGDPSNGFHGNVVLPGDIISAEVKSATSGTRPPRGGRANGQNFTLTITDVTQGWTFSTSSSVGGAQQSSAEWIAEAPSGCTTSGGFCPLADFSSADYGRRYTNISNTSYATVGGKTQPIGQFGDSVQQAIMVNYPSGDTVMAQPSNLQDKGTSFQVNWSNAGP